MYFYEGAKMALQEAAKRGLTAKIYCFDIKDTNEFKRLQFNSVLKSSDVIFALYGEGKVGLQKMLSSYSTENDIQVVFPLGLSKPLLATNPYTLSFSQTDVDKSKQLALKLAHMYPGKKMYFVKTGEKTDDVLELTKSFLESAGVSNELLDYDEASEGITSTKFAGLIPDGDTVVFILESKSKLKAGTFMTKLNQLLSESTVGETAIVGFPKDWLKFDEIQLEYFSRANAMTIMPSYTVSDSINNNFTSNKGFLPYGNLVLEGYDLTTYITEMLLRYGLDFVVDNKNVFAGESTMVLLERPLDSSGALNRYGVPIQFLKEEVVVYLKE